MNKIFVNSIAVIFLCLFININAQQVNTEWVINNFDGFPVGVMVGLDNNDNVFVTGHSGDHSKIITTKYNSDGTLIWERFYSVPDLAVVATWLTVDNSGNIIVTGYPHTYSGDPVESGLLTLKYDNDGNLLWDKIIPGTWAFAVRSIVDQSGNIYVTGRAWQYTATYDFVTVKYAPDGTQLWFDTFDQNSGFHTPTSMGLDQSNNLVVTGGGLSGGLITVMYNNTGVRQWVKEQPGKAGYGVKVDANGGIFITGSYWFTGTGDDMMLLKYDNSGNLVWQKFYDFGNFEYGKLINIDSQSNIFITGHGSEPGGNFPGWLTAKFDSLGNLLWYNRLKINPSWEEYPYFALTGPEDELYVTGNVGVPSGGTTYNGLETVRYNSDGSNPWVADVNLYGGVGNGLALGSDLSLYAVGKYYYTVLKYSQTFDVPVELVSFEARTNGNTVSLNWLTGTETNNSGFQIDRKSAKDQTPDVDWQKVAYVPGHGTTTEPQSYSFKDNNIADGKYYYRLTQIDFNGTSKYLKTVEVEIGSQKEFSLYQNYPNPFNPDTKIKYFLPQSSNVTIKLFDILGKEVATLINEEKPAGSYDLNWNAANLPGGVYFYQLRAGDFIQTKKMILLK